MEERILLNEAEAAKRLGFSREWLRKQRVSGLGPKYVVFPGSNRVRYTVKDLDEWLGNFKTEVEDE